MDARSLARLQAVARAALGAGLVVAPGRLGGAWVGAPADKREGQAPVVGLGARDVAIGLGALRALGRGRGARPWVLAGMLGDAADLVATVRARDALPPLAAPAVAAMAGGSVLLGVWLQRALD